MAKFCGAPDSAATTLIAQKNWPAWTGEYPSNQRVGSPESVRRMRTARRISSSYCRTSSAAASAFPGPHSTQKELEMMHEHSWKRASQPTELVPAARPALNQQRPLKVVPAAYGSSGQFNTHKMVEVRPGKCIPEDNRELCRTACRNGPGRNIQAPFYCSKCHRRSRKTPSDNPEPGQGSPDSEWPAERRQRVRQSAAALRAGARSRLTSWPLRRIGSSLILPF
jgi:hypothetical protein